LKLRFDIDILLIFGYNNSIYKYREQKESDVFPPRTEVLIKDKSLLSGNYPKKYLKQKFVNIDDESFLLNIDNPAHSTKSRNIKSPITSELVSDNGIKIQYESTPLNINDHNFTMFNQNTKIKKPITGQPDTIPTRGPDMTREPTVNYNFMPRTTNTPNRNTNMTNDPNVN